MIGFCLGELGCTLQEAYDMSWAEFVLRSIGFKRVRDYEASLFRILSYETHKVQYINSKKKPPSIDKYWPMGEKKGLTEDQKKAFAEALRKYKEKKNGGS